MTTEDSVLRQLSRDGAQYKELLEYMSSQRAAQREEVEDLRE